MRAGPAPALGIRNLTFFSWRWDRCPGTTKPVAFRRESLVVRRLLASYSERVRCLAKSCRSAAISRAENQAGPEHLERARRARRVAGGASDRRPRLPADQALTPADRTLEKQFRLRPGGKIGFRGRQRLQYGRRTVMAPGIAAPAGRAGQLAPMWQTWPDSRLRLTVDPGFASGSGSFSRATNQRAPARGCSGPGRFASPASSSSLTNATIRPTSQARTAHGASSANVSARPHRLASSSNVSSG